MWSFSMAYSKYSLVPKERHVRKESNGSTLGFCVVPKEHTCPSNSDNALCCPDNLQSEKLCCLWTAITGVTMSKFLIRGQIYNNPWPKCSRKL